MIQISPKAFFFDFDGVIVDSEKAHMMAALETLKPHGISFTQEYYFEKLLGFDDVGIFENMWKERGKRLSREELKQLIIEKNQNFMKLITKHIIYFDGVLDFIQHLHDQNIPLAIVSGALEREIRACLQKADLERFFKFIIAADMVKASKPDPEGYERAWEDMLSFVPDLEKSECWVIEDSPAGITAARAAGLNVIGITNSLGASNLSQADHIVKHVKEIKIHSDSK